jgi:hypothetical protein
MFTAFALAQLPTATILGVVKDSSGAVVPDTTITARSVETGQTRTTTSTADGSYRFSALPVGAYEVRAEHTGFEASVQSGLTLTVGQEAVINITLQVGAVTETVAVTAEAPQVNTTSGSLGGLVGEQTIADLPLNGRNYIDLTLLQPGITQHKDVGNSPTTTGTWYSSNGAPLRSNNYMLDGANLASYQSLNSAGLTGETLGVDGIREYRVITSFFNAEYGLRMGSQMVIVSKGGSNQWHGDVFEYLRNSHLDARNFFDVKTAATGPNFRLPPFKQNQFGGSGGGPIKKDKTFFYAVYEGLRARKGLSPISQTLGAGCHGPAGATITNTACPQLGATTAPVTIRPVIAPFLALYPSPNLGTPAAPLYAFAFTQPLRDDYGQIRVDHNFSGNDSLFARYTADDSFQNSLVPAQPYPGFSLSLQSRNQFATLSENHIFSASLLNTARFSFSRTSPLAFSPDNPAAAGPQLSFQPASMNPSLETGTITMGGVTTLGVYGASPSPQYQNIFTWSDDLFYSRGKHSLKFGTLINRFQVFIGSGRNYLGSMTFANVAGFLAGNATNYVAETPGSIVQRTNRYSTAGFYAQDDYRLFQNFTVNVGVRWEFATQIREIFGREAALRDIQHDLNPTVGPIYKEPSLRNISPRLGFAWDVKGDGKTSVRGGFGMYYDLIPGMTALTVQTSAEKPFASSSVNTNPAPGSLTIPFTFAPANLGNGVSYFDYNMRQPYLLSYNLTVERQLPAGFAITLAYSGSRGIDLLTIGDGNPTIPNGIPLNGVCVPTPSGTAANYFFTNPFCWANNNAIHTNPNFAGITPYMSASSGSLYNAFQFGVSKRLSRGLQLQSSYTWSKSMDSTQGIIGGDSSGSSQPSFPTFLRLDHGPSDFDATQNLRFNALYRLPDAKNGNGVVKGVLNGWQAGGILSLQSGYPFTPGLATNRSLSQVNLTTGGTNSLVDRPDLAPGRNAGNITSGTTAGCTGVAAGQKLGTPTLFFDPCAFTIQPLGFLGTASRGVMRGPGLAELNFSLSKDTAIKKLGEAGKLQFRAEFFNLLNRPNFLIPSRGVFTGASPVATATTQAPLATAGVITSTGGNTSRQIQFALKLIF